MSGRIVNVRPKPGFVMDSGGSVVQMRARDGLTNVVTGLGMRGDARTARAYLAQVLSPQQIEEAFEASAMLRKAITIPATDRVRAWRDWQADKAQIELIEKEEERHQLQAKVRQAEVLRGLGGGALILVAAGDPALPLNVTSKQGLVAINVVSRWHLTGKNWVDDLSRADYGTPEYWEVNGTNGQLRIHPSRVACFRAEPLPSIWRADYETRFWGRGRVPSLLEPAQNLDEALATFSAMIKDALNIDVGIPKLLDYVATADGEAKLTKRLSLMAAGSSVINAKVYDSGDGEGKGGESIDRHQITWTGIPDVIRVYAEAFSAAADIPVTRLWGTSAKGLNATGEGDEKNWRETVETGQKLETKPCLEQIDAALIPSALGSRPPEVWWKFAPLNVPTEKEDADTFKTTMEGVTALLNTNAIPEVAFNKGVQNLMSERGYMPGLDQALAEIPEEERFGLTAEPDETDPSALTEGGDPRSRGAGGDGSAPARRAANDARFADATPRTLYVRRDVVNAAEIVAWAKAQGIPDLNPDLHVTIAYSRAPMDWMKIEGEWNQDDKGEITIQPGGVRIVEPLGNQAAVLLFTSSALSWRHESIIRAGASHDYADYQPHISLTKSAVDLTKAEPYRGKIVLGPEIFEEIRSGD
ncbi:phage portal protein [Sphingomonas soli]|uniref:phage portal protein n=1 Tax=Sphingomonas soli TaxID=266127 RepID=UPI00082EDB7A|nr:anti-CBASS Acb1 family protein [Sphingomonas soli]